MVSLSVVHGAKVCLDSEAMRSAMVSTVFSAIFRKPVSLPPAMVISPEGDSQISSFREISDGLLPS
ncbi:hypothetical protein D3C73_1646690 [compost metagenome]